MAKFCLAIISTLFCLTALCQASLDFNTMKSPRSKRYFNSPGHYEIVTSIDKTQIDPGDSADLKVYITGYGAIDDAKLFISASTNSILGHSSLSSEIDTTSTERFKWGGKKVYFDSLPALMMIYAGVGVRQIDSFGVPIEDSFIHLGSFFDVDNDASDNIVATEAVFDSPPIEFHLSFKKDARPDDYKLNLHFTYFNGAEWTGSVNTIEIKINSWSQRHETLLWVLSAIAAVIAIFGFIPTLYNAFRFWKIRYLKRKRAKAARLIKAIPNPQPLPKTTKPSPPTKQKHK